MELNFLVFPAPRASYKPESLENEMIWIPAFDDSEPASPSKLPNSPDVSLDLDRSSRYKYYGSLGLLSKKAFLKFENKIPIYHIPCLLLKPSNSFSSFIIIYFHGNGEDVNLAYDLLNNLRNNLQINVLAIEYPGYGIYRGSPSAERIIQDALKVYDYLIDLGFKKQNIFVIGRSIGSGAATELAARKDIGVLALISPFTSLRDVVKDMVGRFFKFLLKDRFNNLRNIAKVSCPTLIVHGTQDMMIPVDHSFLLHAASKGPCELVTPKTMDHFQFDFYDDFTHPFRKFLDSCGISLESDEKNSPIFPQELFSRPF